MEAAKRQGSVSATSSFSIVGDGLAGLMLAQRLGERAVDVTVYGDGRSNTPPLALVHLYAGRTFRRSELEMEVFERAVAHWRSEFLAREYPVRRHLVVGDRLDRSLAESDIAGEFAPRRVGPDEVAYGPGFSIATEQLRERLLADLGNAYQKGKVDPRDISSPCVLALGIEAAQALPQVRWDISSGRTVEARPETPQGAIRIAQGLHIAPWSDSVVLGGRFSATGGSREDEIAVAEAFTGEQHREISAWSGKRCSPAADRWPVIGWLSPQRFAFCGFGSRALFWLPYCVEVAVAALLDGAEPPGSLSAGRFSNASS